jgi:hypothetical protein
VRRRAALLIAWLALGACSREEPPPPRVPASQSPEGRALEYLRKTPDEMGVDVLVAVQIYGELAGDSRAERVVEAQLGRMRPDDMERYGVLLDASKRSFLAEPAPETSAEPNGALLADDDARAETCPADLLAECVVTDSCRQFALAPARGRALTRQAAWLLFSRWRGCEPGVEVDSLRREYAARLLSELRADPTPGDLFFERLALLGSLGFAGAIEPRWIESLLASQRPEGCFPADATHPCQAHPTALALWALAHARR